jgi:hypothetical protein
MRAKRGILGVVAVIVALFAYWAGSELYYGHSISPRGISTVRDFFDRFGEPRLIRMVERNGRSYYEFSGRLPPPLVFALPSDPPAYVFDEEGRFVTWCTDPGDAPDYRREWRLQSTNSVEIRIARQKFGL